MGSLDVLREVALHWHSAVRRCDDHDSNVAVSSGDYATLKAGVPPDRFTLQTRLKYHDVKFLVQASEAFVAIELQSDLNLPLLCSFNKPNLVLRVTCDRGIRMASHPDMRVFTWAGELDTAALKAVMTDPVLLATLDALALKPAESLHLYRNGVRTYLQARTGASVVAAIEVLADLGKHFASPIGEDTAELPEGFQVLLPLAGRWSISDDEERAARLEAASTQELHELVNAVWPWMERINAHLDSYGDQPMPETATNLASLAECATEAESILRTGAPPR